MCQHYYVDEQMRTCEVQGESPIPIYVQLMKIVKTEIKQNKLKHEDRIPSERELMKRYNINHLTLSRAMRELVYEGVLYKQHGKGTFVADNRKRKTSISAIAVMVPDVSYFFPPVIKRIEETAYHNNYNVIICNTDGHLAKEKKYIHDFINNDCNGLIIKPIYNKDAFSANERSEKWKR